MNLIDRVKNILITPKTEWEVIANEKATLGSLITSYVIPLALIPTLASFLGLFLFSFVFGITYLIVSAIATFVITVVTFILSAYLVDALASSFGSEKDINKSAQLVAYSATASWIAGILNIIPFLGILASLAGAIYNVYIFYLGLGPMKKTPEDKKVVYIIVYIAIWLLIGLVLGGILSAILLGAFATTAFSLTH